MRKKKQPIYAVLIVDESGSMYDQRGKTISGINEFIEDRKRDAKTLKTDVKMWLTTFATKTKTLFDGVPVVDVTEITEKDYTPRGNTALYDAVGDTLAKLEQDISTSGKEPNVIVCILTDGQENASQEYKVEEIQRKIKHFQDNKNWGFVFLGANQNAWNTARILGSSPKNAVTMSRDQLVNSTGLRMASVGISNAYALGGLANQSIMTSYQDSEGNLIDSEPEKASS